MSLAKDINTAPTPFVNHLNIEQYVGQHVSVHGKCAGIKNGILTLIVQTEPKNEEIMVTNCYVDIPVNSNVKILGNSNYKLGVATAREWRMDRQQMEMKTP